MIVSLTFRRGGLDGRRRDVVVTPEQPAMLGRSPRCALSFPDQDRTVSAAHAKLWLGDDGLLYVTDVGSRYGTFVNGHAVTKARVEPGDRIQFGARGPEATVALAEAAEEAPVDEPPVDPGNVSLHSGVAMTMFRDLPKGVAGSGSISEYLKGLEGRPLQFQEGTLQKNTGSFDNLARMMPPTPAPGAKAAARESHGSDAEAPPPEVDALADVLEEMQGTERIGSQTPVNPLVDEVPRALVDDVSSALADAGSAGQRAAESAVAPRAEEPRREPTARPDPGTAGKTLPPGANIVVTPLRPPPADNPESTPSGLTMQLPSWKELLEQRKRSGKG